MATKVGEAFLELTARNAKLKTKMQESEKAGRSFTQRMQASLVRFGKIAFVGAIAGFTALIAVMTKAAKAAAAEELQTVRLTHQMGRLGVATQRNVDRVEALAAELQDFTRFGDTETRKVLSILMTLSNDFEASLKNVGLAFDIAESGMFDVRTAARYIGLALTGNVEILGRYVSELKGSTNAQLKFMSSSEKAAFAITLLNQKFGGLAKQVGETAAGGWAKLANAVSDAWEALGAGMLDELVDGFGDVTKSIKEIEPALKDFGGVLARVLKAGIHAFGVMHEIIQAIQYTLAPERFRANEAMKIAQVEAKLTEKRKKALGDLTKEEEKWLSKRTRILGGWRIAQAEKELLARRERIIALKEAAEAERVIRRKALTERDEEHKERMDMIVKEADREIEAAERVARTKKMWADIQEKRRKDALADQVAIWRGEAEESDRIAEETESKRLAALAERVSLWRAEAEELDRMAKARAPKEVRRQEPAFVGAEQLWKRAMTMGDTPDIREQKKQTGLLDGIYGETKEFNKNIDALNLGLVE